MVCYMKTMDSHCSDCMEKGDMIPLRFVMLNITSGMWMCSKSECVFPMNSPRLTEFMVDNLTTEKVLFLTKKYGEKKRRKRKRNSLTESGSTRTTCSSSSISNEKHQSRPSTPFSSCSSVSINQKLPALENKNLMLYPVWESEGLRCWLHAELSLLVLNKTLNRELKTVKSYSMLGDLLLHYEKLTLSFNNSEKPYAKVAEELDDMRQTALTFLHPKIFSLYNDEDSPLFSLPLILKTCTKVYNKCEVEYQCEFTCQQCGFAKNDGFKRLIMTLPTTPTEWNFTESITCERSCFRCNAPSQITKYKIEKYPLVLFCHFREGVASQGFWTSFSFVNETNGEKYIVSQIVQYIALKRHFVLWSYNIKADRWLLSDDLGDNTVRYEYEKPDCPPQEVHMLVWEKEEYLKSIPDPICTANEEPFTSDEQTRPPSRASSSASEIYSPVLPFATPEQSKYVSQSKNGENPLGLVRYKPYLSKKERDAEAERLKLENIKKKEKEERELKNLHLENVKMQVPSSVKNSPLYEQENTSEMLLHVQKIFSQDFDDELLESINSDIVHSTNNAASETNDDTLLSELNSLLSLDDQFHRDTTQTESETFNTPQNTLISNTDFDFSIEPSQRINSTKLYENESEPLSSSKISLSAIKRPSNKTKSKKGKKFEPSSKKRKTKDENFDEFLSTMLEDLERQQVADVLMDEKGVVNNADESFDIEKILSGDIL